MIEQLQDFAAGFPEWAQWIAVILVSAIPFVESYFGSVIGVALGMHPVVAIAAAVIGNVVSMLAFVLSTHSTRQKVRSARANKNGAPEKEPAPRRQRLKAAFDRFGVPGVSLIGQTLLPSQLTSAAMVGFGASKNAVIFWQIISIVLWGAAFGTLAHLGFSALLR